MTLVLPFQEVLAEEGFLRPALVGLLLSMMTLAALLGLTPERTLAAS